MPTSNPQVLTEFNDASSEWMHSLPSYAGEQEAHDLAQRMHDSTATKDGHFVTLDDDRVVFIGGPGQGGGSIQGVSGPKGWDVSGNAKARKFLDGTTARGWEKADSRERGDAKLVLIKAIAEESGVEAETVSLIIRQWSISSNDTDRASLELQRDAAEVFGVRLSSFQQERLEIAKRSSGKPIADSATQQRVLRAMYTNTQRELERAGFGQDSPITLFRGFSARPSEFSAKTGDTVAILTNVMSSWTVGMGATLPFIHSDRPGEIGYMVRTTFPRWRIIGSARTGFGCLTEGEFIVLGNPESPDHAYIDVTSPD